MFYGCAVMDPSFHLRTTQDRVLLYLHHVVFPLWLRSAEAWLTGSPLTLSAARQQRTDLTRNCGILRWPAFALNNMHMLKMILAAWQALLLTTGRVSAGLSQDRQRRFTADSFAQAVMQDACVSAPPSRVRVSVGLGPWWADNPGVPLTCVGLPAGLHDMKALRVLLYDLLFRMDSGLEAELCQAVGLPSVRKNLYFAVQRRFWQLPDFWPRVLDSPLSLQLVQMAGYLTEINYATARTPIQAVVHTFVALLFCVGLRLGAVHRPGTLGRLRPSPAMLQVAQGREAPPDSSSGGGESASDSDSDRGVEVVEREDDEGAGEDERKQGDRLFKQSRYVHGCARVPVHTAVRTGAAGQMERARQA